MNKDERVSTRITDGLRVRIVKLARHEGIRISDVFRNALELWCKKIERRIKWEADRD